MGNVSDMIQAQLSLITALMHFGVVSVHHFKAPHDYLAIPVWFLINTIHWRNERRGCTGPEKLSLEKSSS